MKIKNCYLYVYTDPTRPGRFTYPELGISFLYEPFYVGKGSKKRMFHHIVEAKRRNKTKKQKKIISILDSGVDPKDYIVKINDNLSDDEAYYIEEQMIQCIGRALIKQGPLLNLHPGGRGPTNSTNSKLSPKDKIAIKELYVSRVPHSAIASTYNVSQATVKRVLADLGVNSHRPNIVKFTTETKKQAEQLYAYGFSIAEIAEMYNAAHSTVRRILKHLSTRVNTVNTHSVVLQRLADNREEILLSYNSGATFTELEETFKTSSVLLSKFLKDNGVDIPKQPTTRGLELKICKLYAEGYTIADIVSTIGLSYTGTRNVLVRNGVLICRKIGTTACTHY